jgi:hypothetical protein
MPYVTNQLTQTGSFVPTTNIWDVTQLYEVDVKSPEFKELLVRLYQNINVIALSLNMKESSLYTTYEFVTGDVISINGSDDQRFGFRLFLVTGALGSGVTTVNHGLAVTNTWTWYEITGAATNTSTLVGYPIQFAGPTSNNISATVNATQVVITNNSGVTFTDSYVILKYIKT